MTLPYEEVYALQSSRKFLRELLLGPRMTMKDLRERARSCLRHYPHDYAIEAHWRGGKWRWEDIHGGGVPER